MPDQLKEFKDLFWTTARGVVDSEQLQQILITPLDILGPREGCDGESKDWPLARVYSDHPNEFDEAEAIFFHMEWDDGGLDVEYLLINKYERFPKSRS